MKRGDKMKGKDWIKSGDFDLDEENKLRWKRIRDGEVICAMKAKSPFCNHGYLKKEKQYYSFRREYGKIFCEDATKQEVIETLSYVTETKNGRPYDYQNRELIKSLSN